MSQRSLPMPMIMARARRRKLGRYDLSCQGAAPGAPLPAKRGEVRRGAGRLASAAEFYPPRPSPYLSPFRFAPRGEGPQAPRQNAGGQRSPWKQGRHGRSLAAAPGAPLPAKRGEVRRGAGRLASAAEFYPPRPSPYLSPFRFASRGEEPRTPRQDSSDRRRAMRGAAS